MSVSSESVDPILKEPIKEDYISLPVPGHIIHYHILASGALSGAVAKSVIAPLDRIKILFQTDPTRQFTFHDAVNTSKEIYRRSGTLGFWRGHTATIIRIVPYSATNFFVYDHAARYLVVSDHSKVKSTAKRFMAGGLAGSVAVCITYPLETLRARMAVDIDGTVYRHGYVRAVRDIITTGGVSTLYSGLKPTLIGIVPYAGTSFAVYETLKSEDSSLPRRLLAGGAAGLLAQAVTYPLDVVRRRMQVSRHGTKSMVETFRMILLHEGITRGLFKGISMNFVKGPIAVAISMTCNDYVKSFSHDTSR